MLNRILSLLFLLCGHVAGRATVIPVPEPAIMIRSVPCIAKGSWLVRDEKLYFKVTESLKGSLDVGGIYLFRPLKEPEPFPMSVYRDITKTDEFVLLCKPVAGGQTVEPVYGFSSIWPNGASPKLLPHRTLTSCMMFIAKELAPPK